MAGVGSVEVTWERCPDGAVIDDRGAPYGVQSYLAKWYPRRGSGSGSEWDDWRRHTVENEEEDQRPWRIVDNQGAPIPRTGLWIQLRSEAREAYTRRIDRELDKPMVLDFINIGRQGGDLIEGLAAFVSEYGAPTSEERHAGAASVEAMLGCRSLLESSAQQHSAGQIDMSARLFTIFSDYLSQLSPRLRFYHGTAIPVLSLQAANLYTYMAMELGTIIAGGVGIKQCAHCKTFFTAGSGGKRVTAVYCSNRCRVAQQREDQRRREAEAASKPGKKSARR